MNWTVNWISAAVSAVVLAVALAVNIGRDSTFKESEMATDLWLALFVALALGAFWPLTVLWLVLNAITDRVRKRRKRKLAEEWKRKFAEGVAQFIPIPKDESFASYACARREGGAAAVSEDLFDLERDITRDLDEYVFDVNGDGRRRFRSRTNAEIYDVDQEVTEGPVVLVRRSDGARFEVDVHVTVTPVPD